MAIRSSHSAAAVTWNEWQEIQLTEETEVEETERRRTQASATPAVWKQPPIKPLKINRDLLLYRARLARQYAFRAPDISKRLEYQRECEAALRKCLALDATDGRAYVSLGKLYLQQRRYDEARKLYEDGSAATLGENEYIWQAWATLEAKQGNVAQARKLFDAATVSNSRHAAAWHGWGLLEKRQGNFLKARDLWMKGIRATRNTPNPHLYQSLALLAADMGSTDEARQWFREGTKTLQGVSSHALWQAWALMESRQGDRSAVRYLYKQGLDANPRSRYIYLAWALWEKQLTNKDNARKLLERGHKYNQKDAAILQAWALLEAEEGNFSKARVLFKKGSDADPHHLFIWQAWGVLEYRQGNNAKARELFQQGIWADPGNPDVALIFQAWAVLEAKMGNRQLARELFKCAVKANPKSEVSWQSWARLEEDWGDLERADELRNFSLQERVEVVRPAHFSAKLELNEEEPLFAPLFKTVRDWFAKFESSRAVAQRRQPQYLQPVESSEEPLRAPPLLDIKEMRKFDSETLVLEELSRAPELPGVVRPVRR
ncbi:hypothetical protein WJX72_003311 [[Myrmecia] bisecta]|uniref:Pre-mRNA-splicing factor Syf1/CRNKL1-like C-terminal HAT-repeats domain-containing protein n=1 Tax=[Myrmecia] bisecta TaxID=41462 RepID=A0AAW1PSM9_9CHLO